MCACVFIYKCKLFDCNHRHVKSFEESTYTPAILSPRNDNRKSLSTQVNSDQSTSKTPYQLWLELLHRLHDRTLSTNSSSDGTISHDTRHSATISQNTSPMIGIRREKSWAGRSSISPWYNTDLNSTRQVVTLINHYSNMLSAENNDRFTDGLNSRPKSILRPLGSPSKLRLIKEVTFATN